MYRDSYAAYEEFEIYIFFMLYSPESFTKIGLIIIFGIK